MTMIAEKKRAPQPPPFQRSLGMSAGMHALFFVALWILPHLSWKPTQFGLYSAHQMSTCRMGGDAATHPLKLNGETVEVQNLFVADGSAFPACSGVNPMLTIMALAHFTAQGMKASRAVEKQAVTV